MCAPRTGVGEALPGLGKRFSGSMPTSSTRTTSSRSSTPASRRHEAGRHGSWRPPTATEDWTGLRYEAPLQVLLRGARIVAVSPALQRVARRARLGTGSGARALVLNGVDVEALVKLGLVKRAEERAPRSALEPDVVIGALGRLSPEKDHLNAAPRDGELAARGATRASACWPATAPSGPSSSTRRPISASKDASIFSANGLTSQGSSPRSTLAGRRPRRRRCRCSRHGVRASRSVATAVGGTPSVVEQARPRGFGPFARPSRSQATTARRAITRVGSLAMAEDGRAIVERRYSLGEMFASTNVSTANSRPASAPRWIRSIRLRRVH